MKQIWMIAAGEWRYWLRSHLVLGGAALFVLLILATTVFTAVRMQSENQARTHQQTEAEETFLAQPDRHPHRMVHYGHYVFRNPAPLSVFDPGLDTVTGQSIFLEGHRQNSAMFAESGASADTGGLSLLTPALVYQLFAPLLIVLLGHGAIVREREAKVLAPLLAQGIKARALVFGKAMAVLSCIALLLTPMIIASMVAFGRGESVLALVSLVGVYFVYLAVWAALTLSVSAMLNKRSNVLATLTTLWLAITLVLPSIAVNIASQSAPLAGKIESDLVMLNDLRQLGDGHNANDPAFVKLRADLLEQYGVARVEDLPINFRGLVAMDAEQKLTDVLNRYADMRMASEARQAKYVSTYAWLSPTLAVADASRRLAGTDLEHYHRFLKEAEDLRFEFVQGLNNAHVEKLSYENDINRNKDEASWRRARVDAANWEVLNTFAFEPAQVFERIARASHAITVLCVWLFTIFFVLLWTTRSLKP